MFRLPTFRRRSQKDGRVVISASGRYVAASANYNDIDVYDLDRQDEAPLFRRTYENVVIFFQFSLDETALLCGGYTGVEAIDYQSSQTRFKSLAQTTVQCVAFSPDNEMAIVGTKQGALVGLDLATGATQFTLHGIESGGEHASAIGRIDFYSEGRIVSATHWGELQFWDLGERLQLGSLTICQGDPWNLSCIGLRWLPDSKELVSQFRFPHTIRLFRWSPVPMSEGHDGNGFF
jgi:WD40 repeat protein